MEQESPPRVDLSSRGQLHMAAEGGDEVVVGDAAGGDDLEQQESEETSGGLVFSEDGTPDQASPETIPKKRKTASPETARQQPPPAATSIHAWSPPANLGSGQVTGAPFHPPRLAAGGWHNNVAPRRPERVVTVRRSRRRMTHGHGLNQKPNPQPESQSPSHIDEKWPEVMYINDYAVFVGYLSMVVKGTGALVLTWSTVVLLGGFVTMLTKKDFWCLTVITLAQTRIFEVFLNGNISYIGYSFRRLWEAGLSIALPQNPFRKWSVRGLIRVVVFTVVLCPLFALYMFGLFISPGISLWRLVQQDYGDTAAGDSSKVNLKPALVVLYSMALLQGVLFYYRAICSFEEKRLLKLVAQAYGVDENNKAHGSISDYLREMRVGCENDPSFARGKNLVTYAADLMQSNSPDSYVSGARIIDTLIQLWESTVENQSKLIDKMVGSAAASSSDDARVPESVVQNQRMLIDDMIGSASSDAIKKFVQMLDYSSSQSDSREIRLRAMRIVEHFASEIRLSKIPYGIQCVSSFLSNPEASHRQHKQTCIQILWKFTGDEENLRLMSNTNGLALKIIEMLVDSDGKELHDNNHDIWCENIALPGMEVIKRFITVMKRSNSMQLPSEILESTDAISTLESMLECEQCKGEEELQKSVIIVLTQITLMETSLVVGDEVKMRLGEVKERLILSRIDIFLDGAGNGNRSVKKLAGESLERLSRVNENSATILKQQDGAIVNSLTQVVLDKNSEYRKIAADILRHLWSNYTTDEAFPAFRNLRTVMINSCIPELLKEVLGYGYIGRQQNPGYPPYPAPQAYGYHPYPTYNPGYPDNFFYNFEEQEALLTLCGTVHGRLISQHPSFERQFDEKAKEICQTMGMSAGAENHNITFTELLKRAADVVENKKRSCTAAARPSRDYYNYFADEDTTACCIS